MLINTKTVAPLFPRPIHDQLFPTPRKGSKTVTLDILRAHKSQSELKSTKPNTSRLTVPAPLTSTQLLALTLVCLRLIAADEAAAAQFDDHPQEQLLRDLLVFHTSLPTDFATHPLIWQVDAADQSRTARQRTLPKLLLDSLPEETRQAVHEAYEKFEQDYEVVKAIWVSRNGTLPSISLRILTLKRYPTGPSKGLDTGVFANNPKFRSNAVEGRFVCARMAQHQYEIRLLSTWLAQPRRQPHSCSAPRYGKSYVPTATHFRSHCRRPTSSSAQTEDGRAHCSSAWRLHTCTCTRLW